jgi:hypothetical protein
MNDNRGMCWLPQSSVRFLSPIKSLWKKPPKAPVQINYIEIVKLLIYDYIVITYTLADPKKGHQKWKRMWHTFSLFSDMELYSDWFEHQTVGKQCQ